MPPQVSIVGTVPDVLFHQEGGFDHCVTIGISIMEGTAARVAEKNAFRLPRPSEIPW
jgi:hypothetical protein